MARMASLEIEENASLPTSVHADITTKQETTPDQPAHGLQDTAQQLTDQALTFLSTASSETLGACLIGLGAATYVVLGRVGLVLIGVVGGVVLHATWESNTNGLADEASKAAEERRRKEVGLDVMRRVLDWRARQGSEMEGDNEDTRLERVSVQARKRLDFAGFRPETAEALNELTDAIVRDYVKYASDTSMHVVLCFMLTVD